MHNEESERDKPESPETWQRIDHDPGSPWYVRAAVQRGEVGRSEHQYDRQRKYQPRDDPHGPGAHADTFARLTRVCL